MSTAFKLPSAGSAPPELTRRELACSPRWLHCRIRQPSSRSYARGYTDFQQLFALDQFES